MKTKPFLRTQRLVWVLTGYLITCVSYPALPADGTMPGDIPFVKGPWKTILAEAKARHKSIFVAIQRSECQPCQTLEKEAFSDPAVGRTYGTSFISYILTIADADGPALVKQYAVTAYPTLLFLSEDGVLLHRSLGNSGAKGLLTDAAITLETARNPRTIAVWDSEFLAGKRNAEFLRAYLDKRAYLGLPNEAALEAYLQHVSKADWALPKNVRLIASNSETARLPTFDWLLTTAEQAKRDPRQSNLIFYALTTANRVVEREWEMAKTPADLERVIAIGHRIDQLSGKSHSADEQAQQDMGKRMSFYGRTKNEAKYRELALLVGVQAMTATEGLRQAIDADFRQPIDYKDQSETGKITAARLVAERTKHMQDSQHYAQRLHKLAAAYLLLRMTSPADLNQALIWSARAVELVASPANLDTHAQVLHQLGQK
ncbi:thioredoxin family protein [Fibrella aquatilis]|uniref:Thioredoxin family protein n=1 Tax=Fibrella aquatilis TaxID=2817059 RepID=A0A939G6P2_9BACT|nr:thioredoxin family protein [Fibrella aquatilis]MBO0932030.1 thioredoxin family protein [Fibrella aquatilis]